MVFDRLVSKLFFLRREREGNTGTGEPYTSLPLKNYPVVYKLPEFHVSIFVGYGGGEVHIKVKKN